MRKNKHKDERARDTSEQKKPSMALGRQSAKKYRKEAERRTIQVCC